jgi:hypothetical protein
MRRFGIGAALVLSVLLVPTSSSMAQDPSDAPASSSPPSPSDEAAMDPAVVWDSGSVRFEAAAFELRVGDKVFRGMGPTTVSSDPGDSEYRTLEVIWQEQGVEQRMNLYFGADETDWWITEVRTYDGFEEGEWINYLHVGEMWGEMLRTPRGTSYEGDVQFVGSGSVPGELLISGLELAAFAPGTGPAAHTGCRFAVSPKTADPVRPTDPGQPLFESGYKEMSATEV